MEKISLPTDLFIRMQDWDFDADEQLLFLALILNRLVNMTGVYLITHREMRHQIPPRDNDGGWLLRALEKLKAKRVIYYDDNILFIPLIPETSSYAKHVFRHRMQQQIDRLSKSRPSNHALLAFTDWCTTNVSPENQTSQSEKRERAERDLNLLTSDKQQRQTPRLTLAEKHANLNQKDRLLANQDRENITFPTDKNHKSPCGGSSEAPKSLTRAPSSSSSLSSSYYSKRSTGIDVKGGAGENFAGSGGEADGFPGRESDFGVTDSGDIDDEEAA